MIATTEEILRPCLKEPFPVIPEIWICPKTGLRVPKQEIDNLKWRDKLLQRAASDEGLQSDLMTASKQSLLFWINTFGWTYHQFDVEEGKPVQSEFADVPFITWEIQDDLFNRFEWHLANGKDILINKSRQMGASWSCIFFIHWLWLFRPDSQLLELSRTEDYVDKPGNMKALFQRHDYINEYLPDWMLPPQVGFGQKYRTKMHMKNVLINNSLDGESTTQHAASGDKRLVGLLDEFAKVEKGALMRSATRDAIMMRIINSTVAGPGTEYSKWKNSGKIMVFPLMWWDHPDKGKGRYTEQNPITKEWKIRSPWYNNEETIRSPQEMAREIDAADLEAGSAFFTPTSIIDNHLALFGCEPRTRWAIEMVKSVSNDSIKTELRRKSIKSIVFKRTKNGPLRLWTELIDGRLDQTKDYIFGIDLSKGQGASNSVVSIKCKQTNEKIAEWRDANTPPYEMARIVVALAIWCGGRRKLPFLKWEMNGPGWDFGKLIVKEFFYPYYYRNVKPGDIRDKKTQKYGWHANPKAKEELLSEYNRALAHGNYINHSIKGLEEAKMYVYFPGGGIGPSEMVEENEAAKKTHGDIVIADALTLERKQVRGEKRPEEPKIPIGSVAWRKEQRKKMQRKPTKWQDIFDFRR